MNTPIEPWVPEPPQRVGHETRDANIPLIGLFVAGVTILVVGALWASGLLIDDFQRVTEREEGPVSPMNADQTPPLPRLETEHGTSFNQYRQREEHLLSSYRWIDREQKVVQIPIARAMELLAERGLPEPAAAPAPKNEERKP